MPTPCSSSSPTTRTPSVSRAAAARLARRLAARGGRLIVDEAFSTPTRRQPGALAGQPGLVVLRSVGKFFGLAGARVGFVFAEPPC
jgi:cobalamin biosynthetic protein CobC